MEGVDMAKELRKPQDDASQKDSTKKPSVEEDRKIYLKYSSKYGFPEFDSIRAFLELSEIDDDGLFLVCIKKKLSEKIKGYIDMIDSVVHPDTSVASIYENSFFSDEEKNRIFALFRRLMILKKEAELTELDETDEANAHFIREFFSSYPEIRRELEKVLKKEKDSWQKEEITKLDKVGYLG